MDTLIVFGAKYLFAAVLLGAVAPLVWLPREAKINYLIAGVVGGVLAFLLTKGAGALYFDPRPFTHGGHTLIAHEPDNGFPSDHTVLSFTAALLTFRVSRPLCVGLVLLAVLVALCRVLSGVHEPLDVIVGAAIGIVSAGIGLWAGGRRVIRTSV